jgi:CRP/FNR family transcriptional regulator
MNDAEMQSISKTMAHRPVKEGQAILTAGEENDHLYIVVSGTFRLVRILPDGRRQITGFVFPGDFIGLSSSGESPHTAEALEPALVCSFSHNYLDEASARHPGIKDRLLARGDTELNKAQEHIVLLGKQSAEEKVMSFFAMLMSKSKEDSDKIFLPMPRQDIADYLGLRLETLSRTLAALKKSGHLQEVSGRFVSLGKTFEIA